MRPLEGKKSRHSWDQYPLWEAALQFQFQYWTSNSFTSFSVFQWYRYISAVRYLHTSPSQMVVYDRIVHRKRPKKGTVHRDSSSMQSSLIVSSFWVYTVQWSDYRYVNVSGRYSNVNVASKLVGSTLDVEQLCRPLAYTNNITADLRLAARVSICKYLFKFTINLF